MGGRERDFAEQTMISPSHLSTAALIESADWLRARLPAPNFITDGEARAALLISPALHDNGDVFVC
jgi:hypothetical protein